MRSNMKNGRIDTPPSRTVAIMRRDQLLHEIKRVEGQLADPLRATQYETMSDYDGWRRSANCALKLFRDEVQQLKEFLLCTDQENKDHLFREAYDLLKSLQDDLDDFDDEEAALMHRLDIHFNKEGKHVNLLGSQKQQA